MANPRNTIQRSLVMQAVQSLHHHPTAEDVYRHVVQNHPSISRGTVYRNLNLLADQGEIRRVSHLHNAADRFDFNLEPHYHFQCSACGQVFDASIPYQHDLMDRVANPGEFEFQTHEITFTGLCPVCKQGNH